MSRVKNFNGKWKKHNSDTIAIAENTLKKNLEDREWFDEIKGARELVEKAGMETVGMALTHEGLVLIQKIMEDSIKKVIKAELPDLIRDTVREELISLVENNRSDTQTEESNTQPVEAEEPKEEVPGNYTTLAELPEGYRFVSTKDYPLILGIAKEVCKTQTSITSKQLRYILERDYKIAISPTSHSNTFKQCMKLDANFVKARRGEYRYLQSN